MAGDPERGARSPLFTRLVDHALGALLASQRAAVLSRYEQEPAAFFDDAEREIERILRVEGRSFEACLDDLDAFNALTEETENDAWYDRRAAFVSMHLDFLLLGFSRRRLDTLVLHLARAGLPGDASICDVGAGCGRLTALLLQGHPGWRGTLIDRSPAAGAYAAPYLRLLGLGERAAVLTGDLLSLPVEDASFDAVVAAEVLEHTTDAHRAASELVRALRVGGRLAVSLPIDLSIGMHPVVFATEGDILRLFSAFPLRLVEHEVVRPVPELDAICAVFPGFRGCFHATFERVG